MRVFQLPSPSTQLTRRWWLRLLLVDAAIVAVVFVAIQLIPISRDNPPVAREPEWDAERTRALTVQACYDCHSNETEWPWYARIAPASWIMAYDVIEGREDLNFSEWDRHTEPANDPDDPFAPDPLEDRIEDEIRSGRMPPGAYRLLNPKGRLTDEEKEALIMGLRRTVEANTAGD